MCATMKSEVGFTRHNKLTFANKIIIYTTIKLRFFNFILSRDLGSFRPKNTSNLKQID